MIVSPIFNNIIYLKAREYIEMKLKWSLNKKS